VLTPESIENFAYYNFDKGRVFDGSARRDPEALAETVASLLRDEPRRRMLGEFGRAYSVRRLGMEGGISRLEEIYLQAKRRTFLERLWDWQEFLRAYLSFWRYRASQKARRVLLDLPPDAPLASDLSPGRPGFLNDSDRSRGKNP
jgi:glycosyltransferase involved in cell wall biosynthesis